MNKTLIIPLLWLACIVAGCAATQQGIDHANDWLAKPATTQPGSPTNEQNIQAGAGVASAFGPYGAAAGGFLAAGLIILHNLDSRRRTAKVVDAVGESDPTAK